MKVIVKACKTSCIEHVQIPNLPSVISNSQQLLSLFFPSLFMIALEKNPPLKKKKIVKTENSKATSGNEETRCHYQAQLIFLGSCPMGLNSLSSRGWFQLTCCEYPKWVTAVNSMSAICCPLGHFWTAAGLQCQLLTGNMAGLTQFQKGERTGRGRERRREETHMPPLKKRLTTLVFFLHWSWWKCILKWGY